MTLRLMSAIVSQSSLTDHSETRSQLFKDLLNSVKKCQIRYGGRTELASERDIQVADLCANLEAVLSHGLRPAALNSTELSTSTIKQVSTLISGRLNLNDGPIFWHFVVLFLTQHERERFALLKNISTDIGRGRAWIRGSLNEHSLERYFHCMLDSNELLQAHYEDWALMRDQEKSSMFTNMVAGLNSILFAINIDNKVLNTTNVETKSFLKNIRSEPVIITQVVDSNRTLARKQNRRVVKQIITFDDDGDSSVEKYSEMSSTVNSSQDSCSQGSGEFENYEHIEQVDVENSEKEYNEEIQSLLKPVGFEKSEDAEGLIPIEQADDVVETVNNDVEVEEEVPQNVSVESVNVTENVTEDEDKLQSLMKENETLKSQIKRYVNAVQMLKNNNSDARKSLETLNTLNFDSETSNAHDEVKQYETKLIQVAEMHAELMEFNEYLQQQLNFKDNVISHLKIQLRDSGRVSNFESNSHLRGEVYLSIPSAFLAGTGSDTHHVYQIHIKAGNNEWTIYRRYSHFYALHKELKQLDPKIGQYSFPPKKTIRNKDLGLVEKRRKMLEEYLRNILEHWPELGACTSRTALEEHLSFFREPSIFENIKKSSKKSMFSKSSTHSSRHSHYNGL